jgi:hypothetical protein
MNMCRYSYSIAIENNQNYLGQWQPDACNTQIATNNMIKYNPQNYLQFNNQPNKQKDDVATEASTLAIIAQIFGILSIPKSLTSWKKSSTL